MIKELISLANSLDERGYQKEANYIDDIIKAYAKDCSSDLDEEHLDESDLDEEIEYAENLWSMHRKMDKENHTEDQVHTWRDKAVFQSGKRRRK